MKKILYFSFISLITVSCYWDSEEYLYPELKSSCDTTSAVTYSGAVTNLMQSYCLGCHSGSTAANLGGNIALDSYTRMKVYVDNGQLLGSIQYKTGLSPMPKNSTRLTDCQISTIQRWITAGALNN